MRLVQSDKKEFVFSLHEREKHALCRLLQLYPLVPPAHHRLSNAPGESDVKENQQLLEEALTEQRRENRRHVAGFLAEPNRFQPDDGELRCTIQIWETEWLLQVLNDIRVGAWLALGEPEDLEQPPISESNAPLWAAMELAGYFESELLAALGSHQPLGQDEG